MTEQTEIDFSRAKFHGADYDPEKDQARLAGDIAAVYRVMSDGAWRTPEEVGALIGNPNSRSVEAQLRNLRKAENGGCDVPRRNRDGVRGLSEYRVIPPKHPLLVTA